MSQRKSTQPKAQPQPQATQDERVAVVNLDEGMRSIAWYAKANDGERPRVERLRFVPGLNLIKPERFEASGFEARKEKGDRSLDGLEPAGNPTMLGTRDALDLAQRSVNRAALERWLKAEKREAVRLAIQSSLAGETEPEGVEEV